MQDCSNSIANTWKRIGVIMCKKTTPPNSYVRLVSATEDL